MNLTSTIVLWMVAFGAAFVGTGAMRLIAPRIGWMSEPRQDRWHSKATALAGGVGFFPAFAAAAIYAFIMSLGEEIRISGGEIFQNEITGLMLALLAGASLMFLVGLVDDRLNLRPVTKLVCQLIAASLFIFAGGVFPVSQSELVNALLTYFWFVGITNAINMLDNMDGLASGVVILSSSTLVILAWRGEGPMPLAVSLAAVLSASMLGFWWHNRSPAAIFMGDSGSLFSGFVLAALAIPSSLNGFFGETGGAVGSVLALLIPVAVLAVPIFDTTLVTITRRLRTRSVAAGGLDHSSHRLVGLGIPEKKAVWILYGFSAFGGTVAVLMRYFPNTSVPLLGLFALLLVFTGIYLGHAKIKTEDSADKTPKWTPMVSQMLYKRHAAELLLDTVLVSGCFYGAYLLRFEGALPPEASAAMTDSLPLVVASCVLTFAILGVYKGQWRLISVSDLRLYLAGVVGGTALSLAVVTFVTRFPLGHSRSAYLIFGMLLFIGVTGSRLSFRLLDTALAAARRSNLEGRTPVLIYGAGKGGKMLYDEIVSNPTMARYGPIGFVDDDPNRLGRQLCGLPVRSGNAWTRELSSDDLEIWVSSPKIPNEQAIELSKLLNGWTRIRRIKLELVTLQDRYMYPVNQTNTDMSDLAHADTDGSSDSVDTEPHPGRRRSL